MNNLVDEARLGLWSMANPTPPWEYRVSVKEKQAVAKLNRKYLTGAKGGCYYLNSSGRKTYVDKKFCENPANTEAKSDSKSDEKRAKEAKKSGDWKVYVKDKSLCGT